MKKVYICSPLRGDYDTNIENASAYAGEAFRMGYLPIAPHIYLTRFLNDSIPAEREAALKVGREAVLECSEVWVFGLDHPSEGMTAEIALAIRHGIPVKDGEQMLKRRHHRPDGLLAALLGAEVTDVLAQDIKIGEEAPEWPANHGKTVKVTLIRRHTQP